jgi:hypothetical protein
VSGGTGGGEAERWLVGIEVVAFEADVSSALGVLGLWLDGSVAPADAE